MNPVRTALFLVVATAAIALVFVECDEGEDFRHDVSDDVRACQENQLAIYDGLIAYVEMHGDVPDGADTAFLAALITDGIWEDTLENRARLTCPGPGAHEVPGDVDLRAPDSLTGEHSAYAVRDFRSHPLEKFPTGGDEPILACDNAHGMNHAAAVNVLYADRTVRRFLLGREIEAGRLPEDATTIVVGPESSIPDLRKLLAD